MPEIAEICVSCEWQKDERCYGFGRMGYAHGLYQAYTHQYCSSGMQDVVTELAYPDCPTEAEQNGMPCPKRKERGTASE